AAEVFGPQKGATASDVVVLTDRLRTDAHALKTRFAFDVEDVVGGGAAGGLGGALAACGGRLRPGFDVVAKHVGLDASLRSVDLVVTGEGRLDASSFDGKVVGAVAERARAARVAVLAIVGEIEPGLDVPFEVVSLTDLVGRERARADVLESIGGAARDVLSRRRWE
ncbi:MAG: glycerate kinase, partial [Actinomycetota bacterium]|nr:glycerate kinase [Actinomycetota bacterium]